jgi:hypothetical protein
MRVKKMRTSFKIAIATIAGAVIGAVAAQGLHAQAKPKAYSVSEYQKIGELPPDYLTTIRNEIDAPRPLAVHRKRTGYPPRGRCGWDECGNYRVEQRGGCAGLLQLQGMDRLGFGAREGAEDAAPVHRRSGKIELIIQEVPVREGPLTLGRNSLAGSLFERVEAAIIGAHVRIMRTQGHQSSCHYRVVLCLPLPNALPSNP